MTTLTGRVRPASPPTEPAQPPADLPRAIRADIPLADRLFRTGAKLCGILVLLVMGGIGTFLAYKAFPVLHVMGFRFFTETWDPNNNKLGIGAVLLGTVLIASVAVTVAFPAALSVALFITEYARPRFRSTLIALVDLMAAVPSVIYGLWGFAFLQPQIIYLARWLSDHAGFVPLFGVHTEAAAGSWEQSRYTSSAFIAGVVVGMMVLPIAASVMREVFSQTPAAEREGALALGATRWGVIRSVVLPFGRGGIIGGTMLGLGRALGETIAVVLIIAPAFDFKIRILENGTNSVSALIANSFGAATPSQLSALFAAGLVLFLMTLVINTLASLVVARTRSGNATEI